MKPAVLIAVLTGISLAAALGQSVPNPAEQLLQYRKDLEVNRTSSLAHFGLRSF
jgi:hypothetical protein